MFNVKAMDPLGEAACMAASVSDQEELRKIEVCLREAKFQSFFMNDARYYIN